MGKISRRRFVKQTLTASVATGSSLAFSASPAGSDNKEKIIFPKDFIFGVGTAATQIEGAWNEDGKGESIWDRWGHMQGNARVTADVTADSYHRWRDDLRCLKELNVHAYRYSIAWPRVMPEGKGKINSKGLDFYKRFTDELLKNNIKPTVTLFHWDLPQKLQDIGGWGNRDIAGWFADYASLMFRELGDRVPLWTTHNEPWVFTIANHTYGKRPPCTKDLSLGLLASLNALRAHGKAVQAFRSEGLKGQIGITLSTAWNLPVTPTEDDRWAASLMRRSHIEWFSDPIYKGEFPADVWELYRKAGLTMPEIQDGDMETITAPIDFLGFNFYGPNYVRKNPSDYWPYGVTFDNQHSDLGSSVWNAPALFDMLKFFDDRYRHPVFIITENGRDLRHSDYPDSNNEIHDMERIEYTYDHLKEIHRAIASGIAVKGYYHWTLMDNYEWGDWSRCGLFYRDYLTNNRYIKDSGKWYARCIKQGYFYKPVMELK